MTVTSPKRECRVKYLSAFDITASVYLKTGAVEYTNRNRGEYSKSNLPSLYHVIRSMDSI